MMSEVREIYNETGDMSLALKELALTIVTIPVYSIGWMCGFVARSLHWFVASLRAGYRNGRAKEETE